MKQFDKELKERAKNEPFPLLEDYAGRVFRTWRRSGGDNNGNIEELCVP